MFRLLRQIRKLSGIYRKGLENESAVFHLYASFFDRRPRCRPSSAQRIQTGRIRGLLYQFLDVLSLNGCAFLALALVCLNWRRRPTARNVYLYHQPRFEPLAAFARDPRIQPVLYTLVMPRLLRGRWRHSHLVYLPPHAALRVALGAVVLQALYWLAFLHRPRWREALCVTPVWGRAVEFLLLAEFVQSMEQPAEIACMFQQDRHISWLSGMRLAGSLRLTVIQHGALEGATFPHPVELDRFIACPWSPDFYRRHFGNPGQVIADESLAAWNVHLAPLTLDRPNAIPIAVVSQPMLSSRTHRLVELLIAHLRRRGGDLWDRSRILIYPHPLENPARLAALVALAPDRITLHPRQRHEGMALVVGQYSTLAMQYARRGTPVIIFPPRTLEVDFFALKAVTVVRDDAAFQAALDRQFAHVSGAVESPAPD